MEEEEGGGLIHVAIDAETLFTIGPLQFTNSMVGALLASLILLAGALYIRSRSTLVPPRLQSLLELPVEFMLGIVSGSTSRWRGYVALVIGLFLMILVANWLPPPPRAGAPPPPPSPGDGRAA